VTSADAAVIDHVVQAFAAVNGRLHRTDQFARRILALHARHGLEESLGIFAWAVVIGVHAEPVHVAAFEGLLFADYGDVVFRLAGDDAVIASDTGIQVDRHAPGVSFLRIIEGLVERELSRRLAFFREVRLFLVLLEAALLHQRTLAAVRRFHRL